MKAILRITVLLTLLLLATACSTNNRNIVCIETSGVAVIASYNPQTQLPEGKVGYFRGLFFIIPTGLNTEADGSGGSASDVPTVIVKQIVKGNLIKGIEIDNRFIVGAVTDEQSVTAKCLFNDEM